MHIKSTIRNYLDAIEKKFGSHARVNTVLEHRGGVNFILKHAESKHGQVVDMANLKLMTKHLDIA